MKKVFLFGITLFFALLLGLSCKNNSPENSIIPEKDNLANREASSSIDWGSIHNQAMDDLFKELTEDFKSNRLSQNSSGYSIRKALNNHTQQYLTERCPDSSFYPQFRFFQVLADGKYYLIAGDTVLKENLFPYSIEKWGHKLSVSAKSYLEEINALASDESISAENTIIEYNRIKNSVIQNNQLTTREQNYIVMVLQIAIGSTDYWDKNLGKWNNLFSQHSPLRCCGVSGEKAAKADISGAVGGGVAGAIVGGSVSFGVLTVPGWAVGAISGAVGASVTSVVDDLLN